MHSTGFDKRHSGIPGVREITWGSHFCLFYHSTHDILDIFIPYLAAGLANNELCVWAVSPSMGIGRAREALREAVPRLDEMEGAGQIRLLLSSDLATGDPGREEATVTGWVNTAFSLGFQGLRFACSLAPEQVRDRTAAAFGAAAVSRDIAMAAYAYPQELFDAAQVMETVRKHKMALVQNAGRWEVLESSEAHTATEELSRSETRLRSVFGYMSEGFAYHRIVLDETGHPCDYIFLEVNNAFEHLTGLRGADIVGKRVTRVLPGIENDPTDWIGKYGKVALGGGSVSFECHSQLLDKWYAVSAFSPQPGFFAAIFTDITERKRIERRLVEQTTMLDTVMGNTRTMLVLLDADFNFVMANKAYIDGSGYTWKELQGKNHFSFFPNEENELLFRRARDTGETVSLHDKPFEYPNQPWRGVTYWDWALVPVKNETGQVTGLVFSLVDTTERKKSEVQLRTRTEELAYANRELESFSYSVSHDLRGPLHTIKGFADILREDYGELLDYNGRKYLERMVTSAERMNSLIDDLLSLARISRESVIPSEIDLSGIAAAVVSELRQREPSRTVRVSIQDGLTAYADPRLIRIALSNLIGNAWKYSGRNPDAHIEFGEGTTESGDAFFVRDNGAGFDMELAGKLFAPFQRLHSESQFAGTGVGLAIVHRVIERHGGRIWATGEVGKGATFSFTLPGRP